MIHTAQLIYHITSKEEYYELRNKIQGLYELKKAKNNVVLDKRISTHYKDVGISYMELSTIRPTGSFIRRYMKMRINLNILLRTKEYLTILNEKQKEELIKNLNTILALDDLPLYHEWKYQRIDYCCNIKTPYVSEYIHVLNKGGKPRNTAYPLNEHRHRQSLEKHGSLYLVNENKRLKDMNITINFYDKHKKIANTTPENEEKMRKSEDILRLEIQCHRKKIYTFYRSFGIENNGENYMSWYIFYRIFSYYLGIICLQGDYFKRDILIKKIQNDSRISAENKEIMIDFCKKLSVQHKTIWKLKNEYGMYEKAIKLYKKYGYNPITLNRKSRVKKLKNLNEIIYEVLKNNASITQYERDLYVYCDDKYGDNLHNFMAEFDVSYGVGDTL